MQTRHHGSLKIFLLTAIAFTSLLLIWQSGCKEKNSNPVQSSTQDYGTITAVGTPTGSPSTATIGASGGSLLSPDGRSEIIIPSGALSASTQISIQPVTNEAPGGAGVGFSFTPAGQTFTQPVTLRFHYTADDIAGSNVHALAVATQKDDHIWYSFNTVNLDSAAGTVSISSTHFSLYSLYDKFRIVPDAAEIDVNTSQALKVITVGNAPFDPDPNDDLSPLGPSTTYPNGNQVSWTVNGSLLGATGDGTVAPRSGSSTATYTAPATTNGMSSNPAAVTAEVNTPGASKLYLISNIKVLQGMVYEVSVDFTGTNLFMLYIYANYTDHASFLVTIDTHDSADVSLIINNAGKVDKVIPGTCTATPNDNGNLLQIQSVTGSVQTGQLTLTMNSDFITPAFTVNCGAGDFTQPSYTDSRTYKMPEFALDNKVHKVSWNSNPGELVTITATPQ